jgi:hypothetical protein
MGLQVNVPAEQLQGNSQEFGREISEFQERIRRDYEPSSIYVMDETGIWTQDIPVRSYAQIGSGGAYVAREGTPRRDTWVACVRGDGMSLPGFFIHHKKEQRRRGQVVERAVKGINVELMLKWIDTVLSPCAGSCRKVLLLDRLQVHLNSEVIQRIRNLGFEVMFFPPAAAKHLSPLDNSLFSAFKTKIRSKPASTSEEMKKICERVWAEFDTVTIVGMFKHCGLIE